MSNHRSLAGVYAAMVTPLLEDFSPDYGSIPILLEFLAGRGCHGALLLGTTGEGPSFSSKERAEILRAALRVRQSLPDFHLLAGTGTPSLEETIELTSTAFDMGLDGVVVLPPYYFKNVSEDGLFAWFTLVLLRAVPIGGALFGYHIPPVSGVPLSLDLLARLNDAFPDRFAGLKDSSGEADHAQALGERFGGDLLVMNGNDRLFSLALQAGASGCITAPANLLSPYLRQVWDASLQNREPSLAQAVLDKARRIIEKYPPAPALLKGLLARQYHFPLWPVRPPLISLPSETLDSAQVELDHIFNV